MNHPERPLRRAKQSGCDQPGQSSKTSALGRKERERQEKKKKPDKIVKRQQMTSEGGSGLGGGHRKVGPRCGRSRARCVSSPPSCVSLAPWSRCLVTTEGGLHSGTLGEEHSHTQPWARDT